MITLNPTISEANTLAVFALLQVISDPDVARKTLDEINAAKKEAIAADESARRTSEQNAAKLTEAQAALKAATRIRDDFERTHASRTKQLDDQEATLTTKAARLNRLDATLTERERTVGGSLTAREDAVSSREQAVSEMEARAAAEFATAEQIRKDYEQKVAALKAAVG